MSKRCSERGRRRSGYGLHSRRSRFRGVRGTTALQALCLAAGAAALVLAFGAITAAGNYLDLYNAPAAFALFVAAVALLVGAAAWKITRYLGKVELERDRFFTLGIDLFAVADVNGRFLRVNPSFTRVLGWTAEELVSRPFFEFVHPEDRAATEAEMDKLRSGAPVLRFDNRYECKDGSWRVLSWRSAPSIEPGLIYASARDVTELRQAEAEVRRSEENLAVTLRSIGDAVIGTDAEGGITRMNPVAEQLTGWSETEALGKTIDEVFRIVDQFTRNPATVPVGEVLRTGEVQGLANHTVLIARDGSEHPVADSAAPIRDRHGAVIGVVLVFRDVSGERALEAAMRRVNEDLDRRVRLRTAELEKANAQLERSRENLALAQHVALMGSWDLDLLTETGWWSEEMFRLTGFPQENGPPPFRAFLELVHPADRAAIIDANRRAGEEGETVTVEIRSNPANGAVRHFVSTAGPARAEEGRIVRITGTLQDITARKRAERLLAETRERLELAVRAAHVGMWDWDIRSGTVYYSPEYKRQLGFEEHELEARYESWADRLHPDDRDRAIDSVHAYVNNPKGRYVQEFRLGHKDGSYRWIHSQGSVVQAADETGPRMVGTHIDITEKKGLEDQFIQAQKMESVGRLAGGVAHDFNNLLSVINGYADVALQALPADSPVRDEITQIRNAGNRAADLTRQLLAFSRKESARPVVLDLAPQLSEIKKLLERLIGEDIELRIESASELARVRMDPGHFEQIIVNLAVNARDAMPYGGTLSITLDNRRADEVAGAAPTGVPDRFVALTVSDNGIGMDRETLQHAYEPFFTTKKEGKGTGLGLATVYGIVQQNGGLIHAYSEAGRGTSFDIFLPAVDSMPLDADASPDESTARGSETILLVEDNKQLRDLTARMLQSAGYRVLTAGNSEEAIEIARGRRRGPRLLLTDVVMPGMSGPDLAQRLKTLRPGLKVLFMSGYADTSVAHLDAVDDDTHFLPKPFDGPQLTQKIREVLDSVEINTPID